MSTQQNLFEAWLYTTEQLRNLSAVIQNEPIELSPAQTETWIMESDELIRDLMKLHAETTILILTATGGL